MDCHRLSIPAKPLLVVGLFLLVAALPPVMHPAPAAAQSNRTVKTDTAWFVDLNRFAISAHSGFKCEDCHGTMVEPGHTHPNPEDPGFLKTAAIYAYDYSRCQKCHQVSYDRYMAGGHARARLGPENEAEVAKTVWPPPSYAAPTCGACHPSHYVRSGLSRLESGQVMVAACSQCHGAHTASYLDNIHGRLAVNLQNASAAFCSDCHGAHTVTSLKDPEAALVACRRCHPKAGDEYANIVIHAAADHLSPLVTQKDPAIRWIERVRMAALGVVALALVFFFGHSFLWILRELHEKLRKH